LGIGLVGLMLACLLAALMSSVDTYMLVCSALVVRNIYVPFVKQDASDQECLKLGRITGGVVVLGAVICAMTVNDMFAILKQTWIVPMTFAALFWIGMYWRRATTTAGWITVGFCLVSFFVLPRLIPAVAPGLRTNPDFAAVNQITETSIVRAASPSDVAAGRAGKAGDQITDTKTSGGKSIYWGDGVKPAEGEPVFRELSRTTDGDTTTVVKTYDGPLVGQGTFRFDMVIYTKILGMDLTRVRNAALATLDLPFKIVAPFLVMIIASLFTKPCDKKGLDRLYVKMKTPVIPDHDQDAAEMEKSYADPHRFDDRKLFKHPDIEIQRPTPTDFWGFLACFGICFAIIGLILLVAGIGA